MRKSALILLALVVLSACERPVEKRFKATFETFGADFPIDPPLNYSNQSVPSYIAKDNGTGNPITDESATLGRILFYDSNLSANNTIACASCHMQEFAFSDTNKRSIGLDGGLTGRHSMRLVNIRFSELEQMFWDRRAQDLEEQVTMPIQDHVEMGFSGDNGQPGIAELAERLEGIKYYNELFKWVYGDASVTEERISLALADFVRSIQSFDSKFDQGYAQVGAMAGPYPNFTNQENQGKALFIQPPVLDSAGVRTEGGIACQGCHRGPEFDIDPNSLNNGVIRTAADPANGVDLTNTRAPSLRDVVGPSGLPNGPFFHTGNIPDINTVLEHYDFVTMAPGNSNLDPRLRRGFASVNLNITFQERQAVEAFLKTLTGSNMYTDVRWSNPF